MSAVESQPSRAFTLTSSRVPLLRRSTGNVRPSRTIRLIVATTSGIVPKMLPSRTRIIPYTIALTSSLIPDVKIGTSSDLSVSTDALTS